MSTYDYRYDNSTTNDGSGLGSKYGATIKSHNNDAFKHQLCDIAQSMASLCNIGNSCYMNSVIYTLRFTPLFLHNLHHLVNDFSQIVNRKEIQMKLKSASLGRNVSSLQCQNSRSYSSKDLVSLGSSSSPSSSPAYEIIKTTQQTAVEKLHELFKSLTSNEIADSIEPYQSDILLKAIQDVNPIFEGNQQQDAHEFLMCILDSIRESCQSLTKVINDYPEIVVGGLNENVERSTKIKPPANIPPVNERKSFWAYKRRKEDKSKIITTDSPSKDLNYDVDSVNSGADAVSDKNPCIGGTFVENLLNGKQTIQEKIKALGLDFFSEDFEGVTASSIQCLACETTTEQKETMIDLAVPITENMETHELNDSFIQNLCITRERFQGDNKFRCENCNGLTEAVRKISYPKLPRLLIIQLKRFSGGMEKINSYIPTPFTLQCFCSDCISDYGNAIREREHEYKLYSVITHVGSTLQAGHYIAYTCSLNQDSIYADCIKNRSRKDVKLMAQPAMVALSSSSSSEDSINRQNSFSINSMSANSTSTVSNVMKKIGLGRKKSSSNHNDMSKNAKIVNGLKSVMNGSDGNVSNNSENLLMINPKKTLCPSHLCCGIKMKTPPANTNNQCNNSNGSDITMSNGNGTNTEHTSTEHSTRKCNVLNVYSDQYGNNIGDIGNSNYVGSHKLRNEPIWYMCDDDKIKAIPQHEFREMLLPKKNMITPYLLFYARNDVLGSH